MTQAAETRVYTASALNTALRNLERFTDLGFCFRNTQVSVDNSGEHPVYIATAGRRISQHITLTIRTFHSMLGIQNETVTLVEMPTEDGVGPSEIVVSCQLSVNDRCHVKPTIGKPSEAFLRLARCVGVEDDSYLGLGDKLTDCPVYPTGAADHLRNLAQMIEEVQTPFFP